MHPLFQKAAELLGGTVDEPWPVGAERSPRVDALWARVVTAAGKERAATEWRLASLRAFGTCKPSGTWSDAECAAVEAEIFPKR